MQAIITSLTNVMILHPGVDKDFGSMVKKLINESQSEASPDIIANLLTPDQDRKLDRI